MTYKMSLGMAENLVAQVNGNHHKGVSLSGQTSSTSGQKSSSSQEHNAVVSAVESIGKKIVGGIKLPFVSHSHTTPSINTSSSPSSSSSSTSSSHHQQQTTASTTATHSSSESENAGSETIIVKNSNSKSKRPISAQIYESTAQVASSPGAPTQPAKKTSLGSSSSNENIIECVTASSDDDLDGLVTGGGQQVNEISSKVSWREQGGAGAALPLNNRAAIIEPTSTATSMSSAPIPAPRKTKSIMKQFLGGIGAAINPTTTKTTPVVTSSTSSQLSTSPSSSTTTTPATKSTTNQTITSPKATRTIETINEEASTAHDSAAQVDEVDLKVIYKCFKPNTQ